MNSWEWAYLILATIVSAYQALRGYNFQRVLADTKVWSTSQRRWLLCTSDALLYLFSTALGFAALHLAYQYSTWLPTFDKVTVGHALVFMFSVTFGTLGVTGQLPHLLQKGKLLPPATAG